MSRTGPLSICNHEGLARAVLVLGLIASPAAARPADESSDGALRREFRDPPNAARPRVWWHWMNGNVQESGIDADLAWMRRVGLGGVQNFDGSLDTPQVVDVRLPYMSEGWRNAFRHAVRVAKSSGLEFAISSAPGWSETGGPWVKPEAAMKKLVWSEIEVQGGSPRAVRVPPLPATTGPFQDVPGGGAEPSEPTTSHLPSLCEDARVLAYPIPRGEKESAAKITASSQLDVSKLVDGNRVDGVTLPIDKGGTGWILFSYDRPQTIRAATLVLEPGRRVGPLLPSWPVGRIEASDDGRAYRVVARLPSRGAPQQTVAFTATTARYFRLVLEPRFAPFTLAGTTIPSRVVPAHKVMEVQFLSAARVDRFEDKAGWSAARDLGSDDTPSVATDAVIRKGDVVDLTSRMRSDGTLDWKPPAGRWRIVRLGWSLTGKLNNPASTEGTGLEVDKLNRKHVADYAKSYLDLYQSTLGSGGLGTGGVADMVTDSYEALAANWTDDILDQFRSRRGYDPTPYLPVLVGRVVESAEVSDRFLWDFRRTLSDLIADSHYGEMSRQLAARGMGRYGESHEGLRAFVGDGMEVKKSATVPMGAAWTTSADQPFQPDLIESGSVAHLYGQNIVAAESFSATAPAFGFAPEQLKPFADMMMINGVNRFVIHTSVHQPTDQPGPGVTLGLFGQWFTRKETWADMAGAWISYLSRSSYLLQQGRFAADIAWFYGEDENITSLYDQAKPDVPDGYAFDFVNADALKNLLSVRNGRLVAPSGASYRMLVLDPTAVRMTVPTLRRIAEFVKAGVTVVGSRPKATPSLADDSEEFNRLVEVIWGSGLIRPSVSVAASTIGLLPDVEFGTGGGKLRFVHRIMEGKDLYFVVNPTNAEVAVDASFRVHEGDPSVWRADDGTISRSSYRTEAGRTIVPVRLSAHDAAFVVFDGARTAPDRQVEGSKIEPVLELQPPWQVAFAADRGAPSSTRFDRLHSWTDDSQPGIRYFSGVARYDQRFSVDRRLLKSGRILIDLGDVKNVARVVVNGREMGIAWKAPFRVDITNALKPGRNELEVSVANLWPNRMIGDVQPGAGTRVAHATYLPYKANSPLLPSGLLGPVKLLRVAPAPLANP